MKTKIITYKRIGKPEIDFLTDSNPYVLNGVVYYRRYIIKASPVYESKKILKARLLGMYHAAEFDTIKAVLAKEINRLRVKG